MNISDNIKAIREEKRISQAEMSRRLEMEPPAYHRLENRGNKLSIMQLQKIADALDIDLNDILTYNPVNVVYDLVDENDQADKNEELEDTQIILFHRAQIKDLEKTVKDLRDHLDLADKLMNYHEDRIQTLKSVINQLITQIEFYTAIKLKIINQDTKVSSLDFSKLTNDQSHQLRNQILSDYPVIKSAIDWGLISIDMINGHTEVNMV